MTEGTVRISAERHRQLDKEGWLPEHDAHHIMGELSAAAMCYAMLAVDEEIRSVNGSDFIQEWWPWDSEWWKPSADPIRNLEKAGALIAAEIDRLTAEEDKK